MIQTTTDYTMTTVDMAAFRALLKLQGDVGPGMPPPGQAQLWDFFGVINDMVYDHYPLTTNARLKSWMEAVFKVVIETNTCYTITGTGLYVLYSYYQYCTTCYPKGIEHYPFDTATKPTREASYDHSKDTVSGPPWCYFAGRIGDWKMPGSHGAFYDSINKNIDIINDAMAALKDRGNTNTVWLLRHAAPNKTMDEILQFEQSRFDPANWTDSNIFVQNLQKTTIWQDQSGLVNSLLKESTLTSDAYFYLLYLLIGLGTSNQTDRQLAQKIVNAPVTSMEYPNDTFINQLVYLTLMYFADPLGDYGYDNTQLQGVLNDISGAIVSTDPASAAIKQSLIRSLKILHSDGSYPMQDPYNPNIGFNTRQSDTLAALDSARSSLA